MGAPRRGCQCFYCQGRRGSRWERIAYVVLAIVALLATGVVLACDEAAQSAPWTSREVGLLSAAIVGGAWLVALVLEAIARRIVEKEKL